MSNNVNETLIDHILFKHSDGFISESSIISSLRKIGLSKDDTVFVHSNLGCIGKLGDIKNYDDLCNIIIDAFLKVIYPGTLIVPTFSYDFCKNKEYDPKSSKSDVGALTNIFMKREDSIRSNHPIFSVAAIGDEAEYYTKIETNNSFSKNSFFDKLVIHDVKIVGFGIGVIEPLTLIHHIEKMNRVPYRYTKKFKGNIKLNDEIIETEFDYFVRNLELNPIFRFDRIRNHLIKNGALKSLKFGHSKIEIIRAKQTYDLLSIKLNSDPYWLVNIGDSK